MNKVEKKNCHLTDVLQAVFISIALSLLMTPVCTAGPKGEEVVRGDVRLQRDGNKTTIRASDKSIIRYRSFDIQRPETVRFIQPSSTSKVLNRVHSSNPTDIYGTLEANGIVYLTNPAGIYFHNGSTVDVGGICAAAGHISNQDFTNDIDHFTNLTGEVKNWGNINAGLVRMLGAKVKNFGTISAPEGTISMQAGDDILVGTVDGYLYAQFNGAAAKNESGEAAVSNQGTIDAEDGQVALGAGDMIGLAVHNKGTIESNNVQMTADDGDVINEGTVDAGGESGGDITMSADRVAQLGTMHADGRTLGGGNIDIHAEEVVALGSESLTTANAGENGDGGEVIVFSPGMALFRPEARIEARGGSTGGDGGFVEASGHEHIEIAGSVNTTAPSGQNGTFLIDPLNITISDEPDAKPGDWSEDFKPTGSGANVNVDTLVDQLKQGNVTVTTQAESGEEAGNIELIDPIDYDGVEPAEIPSRLSLMANNDITLGADVTDSSPGDGDALSLRVAADGSLYLKPGTELASQGGDIELNAGCDENSNGQLWMDAHGEERITVDSGGGDVEMRGNAGPEHDRGVGIYGANIHVTGEEGDITMTADGEMIIAGDISTEGEMTLDTTGNITVDTAGEPTFSAGGDMVFNAGDNGVITMVGETGTVLWQTEDEGSISLDDVRIAEDANVEHMELNASNGIDLSGIDASGAENAPAVQIAFGSDADSEAELTSGMIKGVKNLTVEGHAPDGAAPNDSARFTGRLSTVEGGIQMSMLDRVAFSVDDADTDYQNAPEVSSAGGLVLSDIGDQVELGPNMDFVTTGGDIELKAYGEEMVDLLITGEGEENVMLSRGSVDLEDANIRDDDNASTETVGVAAQDETIVGGVDLDGAGRKTLMIAGKDVDVGPITAGYVKLLGMSSGGEAVMQGPVEATGELFADMGVRVVNFSDISIQKDINTNSHIQMGTAGGAIELAGDVDLTAKGAVEMTPVGGQQTMELKLIGEGTNVIAGDQAGVFLPTTQIIDEAKIDTLTLSGGMQLMVYSIEMDEPESDTLVDVKVNTGGYERGTLQTGPITTRGAVEIQGNGPEDQLVFYGPVRAENGHITVRNAGEVGFMMNAEAERPKDAEVQSAGDVTLADIDKRVFVGANNIIRSQTGDVVIHDDANDQSLNLVLDGEGDYVGIEAPQGSLNMDDVVVTDEASVKQLYLGAKNDVALDTVTLDNAPEARLSLFDVGSFTANELQAGIIDIKQAETVHLNGPVTATHEDDGSLYINGSRVINLAADLTAAQDVQMASTEEAINVGENVDIVAENGSVMIGGREEQTVDVNLAGEGNHRISGESGMDALDAVFKDDGPVGRLEIETGQHGEIGDITMDHEEGETDVDIQSNVTGEQDAWLELGSISTAGSIEITGQRPELAEGDAGDAPRSTVKFTDTVRSADGALTIDDWNTVDMRFEGGTVPDDTADFQSKGDLKLTDIGDRIFLGSDIYFRSEEGDIVVNDAAGDQSLEMRFSWAGEQNIFLARNGLLDMSDVQVSDSAEVNTLGITTGGDADIGSVTLDEAPSSMIYGEILGSLTAGDMQSGQIKIMAEETMDFEGTLTTTDPETGSILMGMSNEINFKGDVTAETDLELKKVSGAVSLYDGVDLVAENGSVKMTEKVNKVALVGQDGSEPNTIEARQNDGEAGNIDLGAMVDYDGVGTDRTLRMQAEGDVNIDGGVADSSAGDADRLGLEVVADNAVNLGPGVEVDTQGGDILLKAASEIVAEEQSTIHSGAGNITFHADSMEVVDGTIQSKGMLMISPRTADRSIGIGSGDGELKIGQDVMNALQDGFSQITVGDVEEGTGTVRVEGGTFTDDLGIWGGEIQVSGLDVGDNDVSLTAKSGDLICTGGKDTDLVGHSILLKAAKNIRIEDKLDGVTEVLAEAGKRFAATESIGPELRSLGVMAPQIILQDVTTTEDQSYLMGTMAGNAANLPRFMELNGRYVSAEGRIALASEPLKDTVPPTATIYSGEAGQDLAIIAPNGEFMMGPNEKLSVTGDLTITARRAVLGDLNALGHMDVRAPGGIGFRNRPAAPMFKHSGETVEDYGLDFVASTMQFVGLPASGEARFATGNGTPVGVPESYVVSQCEPIAARDFMNPDSGKPNLDLRAEGPTRTNVASALSAAEQVDNNFKKNVLPDGPDTGTGGEPMLVEKGMKPEDFVQMLEGMIRYDQLAELSAGPASAGEETLGAGAPAWESVTRLARQVVQQYRQLLWEQTDAGEQFRGEILAQTIQKTIETYRESRGDKNAEEAVSEDFDVQMFISWVRDNNRKLAGVRQLILGVKKVLQSADKLALNARQRQAVENAVLEQIKPEGLNLAQLSEIIREAQ